jgi:hypothetical protein
MIVTVKHSTVYCNRTQQSKATEYGIYMEQLGNRVERVAGDLEGSRFTATTKTDTGINYVELVHMVIKPLLTPIQNKNTSLLLLSLAR